jgi:putative transposase
VTPARVVGPVGGDACNLLIGRDLAEQLRQHGRVAYVATGDLDRPDLQRLLINSDVDLTPDAAFGAAVLAGVPLAFISYIWTAEGWHYLAIVLDLFSRRVVGWATSDRLRRDLAVEALRRALVARNPAPGLVHHSDRGSQYCSVDYQALLRKRGILVSMSGRGNCYDNSMVLRRENSPLDCFLILLTFFKTIKSELIWPVAWQSRQQAENAVARYIDGFYNPVRRHSSLGFQSPIAFERKAREVS